MSLANTPVPLLRSGHGGRRRRRRRLKRRCNGGRGRSLVGDGSEERREVYIDHFMALLLEPFGHFGLNFPNFGFGSYFPFY